MNTREKGSRGEQDAARFLRDSGYDILETNWHYRRKEIDIIASDGTFIVFVEVKTRKNNDFGEPEEAVNTKKQKIIIHAANAYITRNKIDLEARFDIISILYEGNKPRIHHIIDAFYPF